MWESDDIRFAAFALAKNEETKDCKFITYERFLEKTNLKDSLPVLSYYRDCSHTYFMYMMKFGGVWELSWDIFPDKDIDLYPIDLRVIKLSETAHTHFPALLAELGLFKSASEAKKNGWGKELQVGDHFFKKKTYILRITE